MSSQARVARPGRPRCRPIHRRHGSVGDWGRRHPLADQAHGELGPLATGEVDQASAIEPRAPHELNGDVVAVLGARVDDQRVHPRRDRTDHDLRRLLATRQG